jgi:hypothetical protein
MWRARFGRGCGPAVRQTTKWMNILISKFLDSKLEDRRFHWKDLQYVSRPTTHSDGSTCTITVLVEECVVKIAESSIVSVLPGICHICEVANLKILLSLWIWSAMNVLVSLYYVRWTRSPQISKKCGSHLTSFRARRMTWTKFRTKYHYWATSYKMSLRQPCEWDVTPFTGRVQNSVAVCSPH